MCEEIGEEVEATATDTESDEETDEAESDVEQDTDTEEDTEDSSVEETIETPVQEFTIEEQQEMNKLFYDWAVERTKIGGIAVTKMYFSHGAAGRVDWYAITPYGESTDSKSG